MALRAGQRICRAAVKFYESLIGELLDWAKVKFKEPSLEQPPVLPYVWELFKELTTTRQNGFQVGPITFLEMDAWSRLYGVALHPSDVSAISRLDALFRVPPEEEELPRKSMVASLAELKAEHDAAKNKPRRQSKK